MSYGTFLNAPLMAPEEVSAGCVALVGVPHDSTHTTRLGTRYGPRSIRAASADIAESFARAPGRALSEDARTALILPGTPRVVDVGDAPVFPNDLEQTTESVRSTMRTLARRGAFPVLLGGDHYISYPSFWGFSEGLPLNVGRVGYIHIDGHLDFAYDNPVWGKRFHGSNARRVSELDVVDPRNMVFVGVHGYVSQEQWSTLKRNGSTALTHADVRRLGAVEVAKRAAGIAGERTDCVYVSFDIDVIDTAYVPGTGGVVIGGMTPGQMREVLGVLREANVGAIDLMEVSPVLDPSGRSMRLAAELITHFIAPRIFDREVLSRREDDY
ncbi:MAG TPA: agmatinase family protein [Methylomirabilota bacterium]|jgi:agmatinase|nr:agmatinase family protein [Methylomirabilota bacterium]